MEKLKITFLPRLSPADPSMAALLNTLSLHGPNQSSSWPRDKVKTS